MKVRAEFFIAKSIIDGVKEGLKVETPKVNFIYEDSLVLNQKKFAAIGYERAGLKNPELLDKELYYFTVIDNQYVTFNFYSNLPNDTGFFPEMMGFFKTIEIKENQGR